MTCEKCKDGLPEELEGVFMFINGETKVIPVESFEDEAIAAYGSLLGDYEESVEEGETGVSGDGISNGVAGVFVVSNKEWELRSIDDFFDGDVIETTVKELHAVHKNRRG